MTNTEQQKNDRSLFTSWNITVFLVVLFGSAFVALMTIESFRGPLVFLGIADGIRATTAHVHGDVVNVGTRRDSRIKDIAVEPGEFVSAGQVLARLDQARQNAIMAGETARVEAARAKLRASEIEIELERTRDKGRRDSAAAAVEAHEAAIRAAESTLEFELLEFQRFEELHQQNLVSDSDFEAARESSTAAREALFEKHADLLAAKAERDIASISIELQGVRQAELAAEKKILEAEEAELAQSLVEVAEGTIKAEHDGMVVEVLARSGASVRANDAILTYWILDTSWIRAWVPESAAAKIRRGMKAEIEFDALRLEHPLPGYVAAVLVASDAQERTLPGRPISPLLPDRTRFAVRIEFADGVNLPEGLLPGMSASVTILED